MKHGKGLPVMRFDFEWHPLKAKENAEKRQEKGTATTRSKPMKEEYDFSRGERGKFHRQDAVFNLPVYLDEDNRAFVEEVAQRKNRDISTVVNELIRSDRETQKVVE